MQQQEFAGWLENDAAALGRARVYVPERPFDIAAEAERLRATMEEYDGVNLFLSEGAGVQEVVEAMQAAGEEVTRDPFGHVQIDKINPGPGSPSSSPSSWEPDKVLVQKSGYFARSAAANDQDLALIRRCTDYAVDAALRGESGVVGEDEERGDELRAVEFDRIKGGKAFDTSAEWFTALLSDLGQS